MRHFMKTVLKIILVIFISISLFSCNKYEEEELKAIQDISNNYLDKNDLQKILNPPNFSNEIEIEKPDINKLNLKVYISDELRPIMQIKEDNEWMFKNNNMSKKDSVAYFNLVNSEKFKSLKYRTFDKTKIKFIKPYHYFDYTKQKLKDGENYNYLSFSRFCFDEDYNFGVTVIDYHVSSNGYSFMGYNMSLLIKKIDGKWKIIAPK